MYTITSLMASLAGLLQPTTPSTLLLARSYGRYLSPPNMMWKLLCRPRQEHSNLGNQLLSMRGWECYEHGVMQVDYISNNLVRWLWRKMASPYVSLHGFLYIFVDNRSPQRFQAEISSPNICTEDFRWIWSQSLLLRGFQLLPWVFTSVPIAAYVDHEMKLR